MPSFQGNVLIFSKIKNSFNMASFYLLCHRNFSVYLPAMLSFIQRREFFTKAIQKHSNVFLLVWKGIVGIFPIDSCFCEIFHAGLWRDALERVQEKVFHLLVYTFYIHMFLFLLGHEYCNKLILVKYQTISPEISWDDIVKSFYSFKI